MTKRRFAILLPIFIIAFALRTWYGATMFSGEDGFQVYLIGLKWYTSGLFPFWGPDVVYTESQIPGALQGILVGAPFFVWANALAPYLLINALSFSALCFLGWYLSRRIPGVPNWFLYGWLLSAPWAMHYSTKIENPSYLLPASVMFFVGIWELLPIYEKPLLQRRWAFFWLGFSLLWVFQLHLSWVLLLPFIALVFYFQLQENKGTAQAAWYFSAGATITASTLIPTLFVFGRNASGGVEQNIAFNPNNLLEIFSIAGKFLSFAGGEVVRFIGKNNTERLEFLAHYPWAAPFTVVFAILGLLQVGYLAVAFFIKQSGKVWGNVRLFTLGTLLLLWASYLFTPQTPKAHAFYLLFPVAMWYSFHCYANLFKYRYLRIAAAVLLLSGIIFHVALSLKNSDQYGLTHKAARITEALQRRDYTMLGIRRESAVDVAKQPDIWVKNTHADSLHFSTGFEYPDPYFKPQNIVAYNTYSGRFACKMDTLMPFGLNFKQAIPAEAHPATCSLSGFVKGNFSGDIQAVLDLKYKGENVLWTSQGIRRNQFAEDVWQPVRLTLSIPDTVGLWDQAAVFIWLSSKGSGELFLDDVRVDMWK